MSPSDRWEGEIADASLGKQKTAVCEGKKTEGTSWTSFSEEDALFGSGGPGLGGSLFETDRTELWCLLGAAKGRSACTAFR